MVSLFEFCYLAGMVCAPFVALTALVLLLRLKGRGCRWLLLCLAAGLAAAGVRFGGDALLACWGLAWRSRVTLLLGYVALAAALGAVVFTGKLFFRQPLTARSRALLQPVMAVLCVLTLAALFFFGNFFLLFGHAPEQVLERDGQTVVLSDQGFLDEYNVFYPYHGPLVRGGDPLWTEGGW